MRSIVKDDEKKILIIKLHLEAVFDTLMLDSNIGNFEIERKSDDREEGIYVRTVRQTTFDAIRKKFPDITGYKVYISCKRIKKMSPDANDSFASMVNYILERNNILFFYDIEDEFKGYIDRLKMNSNLIICKENETNAIEINYDNIFENIIEKKLLECRMDNHDQISDSSPVKLKYYISVKPILEDINFFCNVIYKLAISLKDVFNLHCASLNDGKALVVTSMNGVIIGSVIAQLFCIDMVKIDHLGPRSELFINSLERFIDKQKKYYVVTDVVCMGREINSAKSIIKMYGAECEGCLTLVNIVPTGEKAHDIYCLKNIDKSNNKGFMDYKISVDL